MNLDFWVVPPENEDILVPKNPRVWHIPITQRGIFSVLCLFHFKFICVNHAYRCEVIPGGCTPHLGQEMSSVSWMGTPCVLRSSQCPLVRLVPLDFILVFSSRDSRTIRGKQILQPSTLECMPVSVNVVGPTRNKHIEKEAVLGPQTVGTNAFNIVSANAPARRGWGRPGANLKCLHTGVQFNRHELGMFSRVCFWDFSCKNRSIDSVPQGQLFNECRQTQRTPKKQNNKCVHCKTTLPSIEPQQNERWDTKESATNVTVLIISCAYRINPAIAQYQPRQRNAHSEAHNYVGDCFWKFGLLASNLPLRIPIFAQKNWSFNEPMSSVLDWPRMNILETKNG